MIAAGTTLMWVVWGLVLLVSVGLMSLYSGLETGVYVLNKFRLDLRAEEGNGAARRLKKTLSDYTSLLGVLLIGTNVASHAATFAITAMFVLVGTTRLTELCTLAVATPILFIFGDSVPKNVFQRQAERLVYRLSWVLTISNTAFRLCGLVQLVRAFAWLVTHLLLGRRGRGLGARHDGFAAIVAEGMASGLLTHSQSVMAERVMDIGGVTLGDVMVPMDRVVGADTGVSRGELTEIIRNDNYSRLPLADSSGQVQGILDIYKVLLTDSDAAPADQAVEPFVLGDDTTVTNALYHMQRSRQTMVVVCNAQGRHVGIATVKDLVEEIVGELAAW